MKLNETEVGDYVSIWCIGTLQWDDEIVKIKDIGGILVTVEYKNGHIGEFSNDAICKKINF